MVKADAKSVQNVDQDKPPSTPDKPSVTLVNATVTPVNPTVTPANTTVTPAATAQQSTEISQSPSNIPDVVAPKTNNAERGKDLKNFSVNFKVN